MGSEMCIRDSPYTDDSFEKVADKFNWNNSRVKHTFFIGTKHLNFINFKFPKNSLIIDPFRYIYNVNDCQIIRIGDNINN